MVHIKVVSVQVIIAAVVHIIGAPTQVKVISVAVSTIWSAKIVITAVIHIIKGSAQVSINAAVFYH